MDDETTSFVEAGCALIIGTVAPDGEPCAGRGWGLTVLAEPGHVRLLVDADDHFMIRNVTSGAPVAITAASILTLQSIQMKGRLHGVEPATEDDLVRAERYCGQMFSDIHETDFTPLALLEELRPHRFVACTAVVSDLFDQTPGPAAGARVDGR